MNPTRRFSLTLLTSIFLLFGQAYAAVSMPPIEHKPFATHKIVLEISDASPVTQNLILNVAANLENYYGSDKLDLEIVAFGPGLKLLLANNVHAPRIRALSQNYGIKFDACANTLHHFTKKLGYQPELNPASQLVPAGAARIVELVQHGYAPLRP